MIDTAETPAKLAHPDVPSSADNARDSPEMVHLCMPNERRLKGLKIAEQQLQAGTSVHVSFV